MRPFPFSPVTDPPPHHTLPFFFLSSDSAWTQQTVVVARLAWGVPEVTFTCAKRKCAVFSDLETAVFSGLDVQVSDAQGTGRTGFGGRAEQVIESSQITHTMPPVRYPLHVYFYRPPSQSASSVSPATPRFTQWSEGWSEGSLRNMTKLVEWPVVESVPLRSDVL